MDIRKPLRLWPAKAAAALQLAGAVVAMVSPKLVIFGMMAGLLGGVLILVWWLFFSRARWIDRLSAIAVMVLAVIAVLPFLHESIAGAGMGRLFPILSVPMMTFGLAAWAVAGRGQALATPRRLSMALAILIGCATWTLARTDGVTGDGGFGFRWRWSQTAEQRLLAQSASEPMAPVPVEPSPVAAADPGSKDPGLHKPVQPLAPTVSTLPIEPRSLSPGVAPTPAWPGFRGPNRDSVIRGVRIATDWSSSPPAEIWRRPIGPGWSSFAVAGDLLYTQEQRGAEEIVGCYKVSTGEPVWRHKDAIRFYESNAGPGPRATPTLSNGRVYAFGATGVLNALDARTGRVIWSRDVAKDTDTKVPMWGFAGSPLVEHDVVIVAASGKLAGYDAATGSRRWLGPIQRGGYSSPHRVTIGGVSQILLLNGDGVTSVAPDSGAKLWDHAWPDGATIVQPAVTEDGDVLINTISMTGGLGIRRLAVAREPAGWKVDERWTSTGLKPYFNDFVVHKGHAYGFDGNILSSINVQDGKRAWKGGRYGAGQLILLADQDLLLVLSEEGDLVLVSATPDKFNEIAKFKAIEGKTWNHPVLVGDVLLVRNGEEMAAFRVKIAGR